MTCFYVDCEIRQSKVFLVFRFKIHKVGNVSVNISRPNDLQNTHSNIFIRTRT